MKGLRGPEAPVVPAIDGDIHKNQVERFRVICDEAPAEQCQTIQRNVPDAIVI